MTGHGFDGPPVASRMDALENKANAVERILARMEKDHNQQLETLERRLTETFTKSMAAQEEQFKKQLDTLYAQVVDLEDSRMKFEVESKLNIKELEVMFKMEALENSKELENKIRAETEVMEAFSEEMRLKLGEETKSRQDLEKSVAKKLAEVGTTASGTGSSAGQTKSVSGNVTPGSPRSSPLGSPRGRDVGGGGDLNTKGLNIVLDKVENMDNAWREERESLRLQLKSSIREWELERATITRLTESIRGEEESRKAAVANTLASINREEMERMTEVKELRASLASIHDEIVANDEAAKLITNQLAVELKEDFGKQVKRLSSLAHDVDNLKQIDYRNEIYDRMSEGIDGVRSGLKSLQEKHEQTTESLTAATKEIANTKHSIDELHDKISFQSEEHGVQQDSFSERLNILMQEQEKKNDEFGSRLDTSEKISSDMESALKESIAAQESMSLEKYDQLFGKFDNMDLRVESIELSIPELTEQLRLKEKEHQEEFQFVHGLLQEARASNQQETKLREEADDRLNSALEQKLSLESDLELTSDQVAKLKAELARQQVEMHHMENECLDMKMREWYKCRHPDDAIDVAVCKTLQRMRFPIRISFKRQAQGVYMADKRVSVTVTNDQVMVRKGGGFEPLTHYLEELYLPMLNAMDGPESLLHYMQRGKQPGSADDTATPSKQPDVPIATVNLV
eukprot:GFYU01006370.1.p1 GENE.GFYU01006370.1~~GFYU01006370.1.p1  ORF type:complete len:689 (+),score=201.59 GFYU01006370.1:145-2211(+)